MTRNLPSRAGPSCGLIGVCFALLACGRPQAHEPPTPPAAAEPSRAPTTEAPNEPAATGGTETETGTEAEAEAVVDPATSPPAEAGELLVATASGRCTTRKCSQPCCNACGRVLWKLASDPDLRVVARGVTLPRPAATDCALHYDLRVEGERKGKRFVVRALRPVPSRHGRRPGTPAQLKLELAKVGVCKTMSCGPSVALLQQLLRPAMAPQAHPRRDRMVG